MPTDRLLLHCPQMQAAADRICKRSRHITAGRIDWERFPDGFPNLFIHDTDKVRASDVAFLASFHQPDLIFEQWSAIMALAELSPRSLRILLPYFPTGTMERIDTEGQVATASTLSRLFAALPPAGPGPIPLYLWDVHALPIRHYFDTKVVAPQGKTGTKLLRDVIASDAMIAFPDEGAWKRFKIMFSDRKTEKAQYDFVICRKVRGPGDKRVVTIGEGDPAGRDVVIVDDLIHSGSTLIECGNVLKKAGAASVSCYATHGVLENNAHEKFIDAGFRDVFLTDSVPTTAGLEGRGQFRILHLTDSMINAILD